MVVWVSNIEHSSVEWLQGVFEKSPSVLSALDIALTSLNMESSKTALESIFDEQMSGMEWTLEEHSHHNAIAEVNHRASVLSQRAIDSRFRVNAFT